MANITITATGNFWVINCRAAAFEYEISTPALCDEDIERFIKEKYLETGNLGIRVLEYENGVFYVNRRLANCTVSAQFAAVIDWEIVCGEFAKQYSA